MLASFFIWGALGMPIGFAMLCSAFVYLIINHQDIGLVASQSLNGLFRSFVLLAVPLFILAAEIMNAGTVSERLLKFASLVVGRIRGGLAHVTVIASMIFSGMSGSAIADAAGPGKLMIEMMLKEGRYKPGFAGALAAAAATIGPIIPPSIPMVLYAMVANTSVGYLFLGGFLPGVLMGVSLMIVIVMVARRDNLPVEDRVPMREVPGIMKRFAAGADVAGDPAGRHLFRHRDADRSRRRGRRLCPAARLRLLSRLVVQGCRQSLRRCGALDGHRRIGRRRRAADQLCRRRRTDPQRDRRLDRLIACVAAGFPADHQPSVPGAWLLPRYPADAAGHRAHRHADHSRTRHRSGAFWRYHHRQSDDRHGDAAL